MEHAGVAEALRRGIAIVRKRQQIPTIPMWMTTLAFVDAEATANLQEAGPIIQALRASERQLRARVRSRSGPDGTKWSTKVEGFTEEIGPLPRWAADGEESQRRMVVAMLLLLLEALA